MDATHRDIQAVMRAVHGELSQALDAPICLCGVFDAPTQTVEVVWQVHAGQELPGGSFPLGNGFTSQVIRTGQPLLIRDWSASGPRVQVQYATDHLGLPQSSITAPLRSAGLVRGVISIQSYQPDAFAEADLTLLANVADRVAATLFEDAAAEAPPDPRQTDADEGRLTLDTDGRMLRLNDAARKRLCGEVRSVILGHPILQSQSDQWPLGTQALTDRLRPLVEGQTSEVHTQPEETGERLAWSASTLQTDGKPAGTILEFKPA